MENTVLIGLNYEETKSIHLTFSRLVKGTAGKMDELDDPAKSDTDAQI